VDGPTVHPDSTPPWLIVRYGYPARDEKPPVQLTWYHGGKKPDHLLEGQTDFTWNSGVMFIGDQGQLISDYGRHVLLPEEKYKDFQRPTPFIADSIGHHAEWILACKTGQPTTCSFDYSGPLTEAALLGNVAYRTGCAIEWDSARLRATNCSQAAEFVQHRYRKGWKL
jgi:hypothetical protein